METEPNFDLVDPSLVSEDKYVMEKEEKLGDFCLVCCSKVDRSKLPKEGTLLSNNLNVIFILKNLLQVPSELLVGNFRKCGSPAYWITFCEKCSDLTSQAMECHLQILTLVNQLRSIVRIITDKIKMSSVPLDSLNSYQENEHKEKSMQEKRLHILRRTREFVTKYDYNIHLVNPFIEGDKLARKKELDNKEDESLSGDSGDEDLDDNGGIGGGWQEEDDDVKITDVASFPSSRLYEKVEGKWKCRHCDKSYGRIDTVRHHEDEKHAKVPGQFKCDICGKRLNSKHWLYGHLRQVHKLNAAGDPIPVEPRKEDKEKRSYEQVDGKWKCRYCDKLFKDRDNVQYHEDGKHPKIPGQFVCEICGKGKNSKYYLYEHMRKVHKINAAGEPIIVDPKKLEKRKSEGNDEKKKHVEVDGKWKCRHCDKLLLSKTGVNSHERREHPLEFRGKYECDICGKRMIGKGYLLMHRKLVHQLDLAGNPVIREPGKVKATKRNSKPRKHWPVDGKWKCGYCDKEFNSRKQAYTHEKEKHPLVPGQFVCDICGQAFNSMEYLRTHRRNTHYINASGKPVNMKSRKRKMIEESVNRKKDPSTCHLCGKSFKQMCRLKAHLKFFHEKEFDVSCHVCGIGVYSSYNLKMHLLGKHRDDPVTQKMIEEGVKIWKCEVLGCVARYLSESGLEEHTRKKHGGGDGNGEQGSSEHRFSCKLCSKSFWYWHRLKTHKLVHRPGNEKRYSCDVCGGKFKAPLYVRRHKKQFHSQINA